MKVRIGVKYCGGCSPHYERTETVKWIKESIKDRARLVPFSAERVNVYLVVCGCKTMCADTSAFDGKLIKRIKCAEDAERFIDFINKMD